MFGRALIAVLTAITLLLGTMGLWVQPAGAQGEVVPDGTYLPQGQPTVWEVVDHPAKTIKVWGGALPNATTTSGPGERELHAWTNYPSAQVAEAEGCKQAVARQSQTGAGQWASGYSVFFQDRPFSGQCAQSAPTAGPQQAPPSSAPYSAPPSTTSGPIQNPPGGPGPMTLCRADFAVTPGTWMPSGHPHIRREFTWSFTGGPIDVKIYSSAGVNFPMFAGSNYTGKSALDERAIWHRCDGADWSSRDQEACQEAARVMGGSLGVNPRAVYLNDQLFNGTCSNGAPAPAPGKNCPVTRVNPGTTLPAGTAVIVRAIGSDNGVYIYNEMSLSAALYVHDQWGFAVWTSCDGRTWEWQDIDACAEAVEVIRGGLDDEVTGKKFPWTTVWLKEDKRPNKPLLRMPTPNCIDP